MKNINENGQALFEFIIFIPFILLLLSLLISIAGSINGSINQQKVTRSYFYFLAKGNSMLPSQDDLINLRNKGIRRVGAYSIGWRHHSVSNEPVTTCYKLSKFLGSDDGETCDTPLGKKSETRFVRVMTAYGVCSTTYDINSGSGKFDKSSLISGSIGGTCILE